MTAFGLQVALEDLFQFGLEEGDCPGLQPVHLGLVNVHPDDLEAEFGHAGGVRGAQVAGADDGEPWQGAFMG